MKFSKYQIEHDMVPTVISDDGRRKVIRYSLKKKSTNLGHRNNTPGRKPVEFIDAQGFRNVERVVRVERREFPRTERSKSSYIGGNRMEKVTRTVGPSHHERSFGVQSRHVETKQARPNPGIFIY